MASAELALTATAASVSQARRFLGATLVGWAATSVQWAAEQVLSELATNAVIHAGTPFRVRLRLADEALRIEVQDGSPRTPRQRHYGMSATTGRGLALVSSLSHEWGVVRDTGGKTVWCLLPLGEQDDAAEPDLSAFLTEEELVELGLGEGDR